jgi:hypothetical protein
MTEAMESSINKNYQIANEYKDKIYLLLESSYWIEN